VRISIDRPPPWCRPWLAHLVPIAAARQLARGFNYYLHTSGMASSFVDAHLATLDNDKKKTWELPEAGSWKLRITV